MIPMIASTFEYFILKYAKIILWVMVSGGLAAALSFIPHFPIDTANVYQVALIAAINGLLSSALSTVNKRRDAAVSAVETVPADREPVTEV